MLDLNQQPYFDDYNKDGVGNNPFLRILFRPGYPVQARELTQIQSILQAQVERLGGHFFKDGSKVIGGDVTINKVVSLKLDASSITQSTPATFFSGMELRNSTGVLAKVVELTTMPSDSTDDFRTLYVQYTTSGEFFSGEELEVVGQNMSIFLADDASYQGEAVVASIQEGVFFTKGYFVHTDQQSVVVGSTWNVTTNVGLSISDYVLTESEDNSLLDPAYGSYNFNAPGAHRYVIDIELTTRVYTGVNETDPNFIEIIRLVDGEIASEIKNPKYSEFEDELARRTYDESGSYTVKPFKLSFEEHPTDPTKLSAILDAGKAYINGYEFETASKTTLTVDRARDVEFYNNTDAYATYGTYYIVNSITGGVFDISSFESVALYDESAIQIGSARVKNFSLESFGKYRVYLTDIQVTNSDSVRSIVSLGGAVATVDVSVETTGLVKGGSSSLILPFYPENPKQGSITDVNYKTQRAFSGILDTSKSITIYTNHPGERFTGSGSYGPADVFILQNYTFLVDGVLVEPISTEIPSVGNTEVGRLIATFASGSVVSLIASVEVNSSVPKSKLRRTASELITVGSAWVPLGNVDVIKSSVVVKDEFGVVITENFIVEDGQRDEYYDFGRIRRIDGVSAAVTVEYEYFEHSGVGYFTVDSYSGEEYADIPKYTSGSVEYDLKSCFDFRPSIQGTVSSQIPVNNTAVSFDYEYFVPRYDRIILTKSRELAVIKGIPALTPTVPPEPVDSMTLYVIRLSPYTVNEHDVGVRFIENKRYTMRDIGKLEKRIENLEYYTTLSLLETKTSTLSAEGKFRNGFIVDPFKNYDVSEITHYEFDCYIDVNNNSCTASFIPSDRDAMLVSVPSGVIQTDDGVLIRDYTEAPVINQTAITGFINVNPFNVFTWVGKVKMTPEVDNWIEENRLPTIVNTIVTNNVPSGWRPTTTVVSDVIVDKIKLTKAWYIDGAWTWEARNRLMNDFVRRYGIPSIGVDSFSSYGAMGIAKVRSQVVSTTRVQETIKVVSDIDETVSTSAIPYIRTKDVTVVIENLLPDTRYYFSFDGVDVDAHVKPLENGTIVEGAFGDIVKSNSRGVVKALFRIPGATFKTGERVLRISDNVLQDKDAETSYAVGTYTAEGFVVVKQRTLVLNKIRDVVSDRTTRTVVSFTWYDPLAQTFMVDDNKYPDGLFVSSVDLFFVSKDEKVPVSVAIRPTVNGYPSSTETYPFATATVQPEDVVVNDLSSTTIKGYASDENFKKTRFKFDTPVYLSPGEHSFIVMANTNTYRLAYATIGKEIYNTTKVMTENPYNGVMFMSQNASTWSADQYSDITFSINRAVFTEGESDAIVWNISNETPEVFDTINFSTGVTSFESTNQKFTLKTKLESDGSFTSKAFDVDKAIIMNTRMKIDVGTDVEVTGKITSTKVLSPVIDLQRTHFVLTQNWINNDSTDEEVPYSGSALSRYIHKKVTLAEDFISTDIRVWMDAYIPSGASIKVYAKYQNTTSDSSAFDDLGWAEVPQFGISGNEVEYRLDVPGGFNVYQTKVVLLASDPTKVPAFTNLRVVTFQE